jgi:hypothetical protein
MTTERRLTSVDGEIRFDLDKRSAGDLSEGWSVAVLSRRRSSGGVTRAAPVRRRTRESKTRIERAMGIEYIAKRMSAYTKAQPCVRFLCEKRCRTSQRQPISAA